MPPRGSRREPRSRCDRGKDFFERGRIRNVAIPELADRGRRGGVIEHAKEREAGDGGAGGKFDREWFYRFLYFGYWPGPGTFLEGVTRVPADSPWALERAQVLEAEQRVNSMEVEIDLELQRTIAMRQPAASDLRLLIAVSKASGNLERVGDEAARIARTVQRLINVGLSSRLRLPMGDLQFEADLAVAQLRKSLDAFARLDVAQALEVLKQDDAIDQEFDGLLRKLITYMMEDPRTISSSIDLVFVAKAIERIGDHAKNLAEATIYVVKGTDVRHHTLEDVENVVR